MTSRKRKQGDPRRAVGYVRVSTGEQGTGLESQRLQLESLAAAKGLEIVAWGQDEGVSGAAPLDKRPGLMEALGALHEHGAGVLLACRRDRLARDPVIMWAIEGEAGRAGAAIITGDVGGGEDPGAVLARGVIDLAAQYERASIAARVRAGMRRLQAAGLSTGTPPVGYALGDSGRLVPSPESAAVARVLELAAEGVPHRQIADRLQAEGYSPRGARWHPTTVIRILRRARAYGGPPPCPTPPEGATDGGGGLSQSA